MLGLKRNIANESRCLHA